ncbi:MAG: dihydroorotase [Alphaproteobacteria bacterium]
MSATQAPVAYINARLLDPASGRDERGALVTADGKIIAIHSDPRPNDLPADTQQIDCGGHILAPGLIDMRVQLGEPGQEHKDDIASISRAAAAGGVTSVVALPNTNPVLDDIALVEFVARRAREVKLVKVHCTAAITRGLRGQEITEMGLLSNAGVLAFTDGTQAVANTLVMSRALTYATTFDALIIQHPEEPSLAADGVMHAGELSTRLGLPGIPAEAEVIMLDRDLTLAAMTGARYHAAHISTAAAVDSIRRAKADGLRVTCDTAPPYFALNELAVGDYRTFAKLSPPLRAEADRQAIVAGLKDGTIDIIASDHTAQDQDSKRLPFDQAEPGAAGLETLLQLTLELFHNASLGLIDALAKLTCRPAELLGLPLGQLQVGACADLVLFDLDRPGQIDATQFQSKSKNTPFEDRLVQGRVLRTIVDGRPVFEAPET